MSRSPAIPRAARPLIGLVRGYQYLAAGRPSPCRHVPSCSTYAIEALEAHGAVRGTALAAGRVLRCNPWGSQGFDPVPDPRARGRRSSWGRTHGSLPADPIPADLIQAGAAPDREPN